MNKVNFFFLLSIVDANLIDPPGYQMIGSRAEVDCDPHRVGFQQTVHGSIRVLFIDLSVQKNSSTKQESLVKYDTQLKYTGTQAPSPRWHFILPHFYHTKVGGNLPEINAIIRRVSCADEGNYTCSVKSQTASGSIIILNKTDELKCLHVDKTKDPVPEHHLIEYPATIRNECCEEVIVNCNVDSIFVPKDIVKGLYEADLYRTIGNNTDYDLMDLLAVVNFQLFKPNSMSWIKIYASAKDWDFDLPTAVEANASRIKGYDREYIFIRGILKKPDCKRDMARYYCRINFFPQRKYDKDFWEGFTLLPCSGPKGDENKEDDAPFLHTCVFDLVVTCCDLMCIIYITATFTVLILILTVIRFIVNRTYNVISLQCDHNTTAKVLGETLQTEKKVSEWITRFNLTQFGIFINKIKQSNEMKPNTEVSRLTKVPYNAKKVSLRVKLVKNTKRKILYFVIMSATPVAPTREEKPSVMDGVAPSPKDSGTRAVEDPLRAHLRKNNVRASELMQYGTPV